MRDTLQVVRAAAVQAAPVFLDGEATLEKATRLIGEAAEGGADLIVMPESLIPGYPVWLWASSDGGRSGLEAEAFARLYANAVEVPGPVADRLGQRGIGNTARTDYSCSLRWSARFSQAPQRHADERTTQRSQHGARGRTGQHACPAERTRAPGEFSMGLQLDNLDDHTRRYMLDELKRDISGGKLYLDPRLTERGRAEYVGLLQVALQRGAHASLADDLRSHGRMRLIQEWQRPRGGVTVVDLPLTAPDALAEGEFHRLYARGLCRRALGAGIRRLVIYRARAATKPRANSDAMVGMRIDGASLLEDLRTPRGVTSPCRLPVCLDAGLSVQLP